MIFSWSWQEVRIVWKYSLIISITFIPLLSSLVLTLLLTGVSTNRYNDDKTEFLIVGTRQQLAKVNINCIRVELTDVCPVTVARNLGSWFDEQLTMSTHISKLCGVAFYHLHNIKCIRKYLSRESTEMHLHAFITSRVDYCNSLLYGLRNYQLNKLQRVLNSSAMLVCNAPRFRYISPLLRGLHWLPVKARIQFKIRTAYYVQSKSRPCR